MYQCTDDMIESYLDSNVFVDTIRGDHNGWKDSPEIHAQRIASLINLRRGGTEIHPVVVFIDTTSEKNEVDDGWHRLRAAYYMNEVVDCQVEFD